VVVLCFLFRKLASAGVSCRRLSAATCCTVLGQVDRDVGARAQAEADQIESARTPTLVDAPDL
jgi:hypothetical protein